MSTGSLVVVGDTLLDRDLAGHVTRLCPDAPAPVVEEVEATARPGGAGLAAVLAAMDGRPVVLVTALGRDEAGREAATLLRDCGVEVVDLGLLGPTPEKIRIRGEGRTLVRLDRGGGSGCGPFAAAAAAALHSAAAVLVSDYGQDLCADPRLREELAGTAARIPVVWDPHPRGAAPVAGVALATPNRAEARAGPALAEVAQRARELCREWSVEAVAVTLGAEGALLVIPPGVPRAFPAPELALVDSCGAGDRFAAAAAGRLALGYSREVAVGAAVAAASTFVGAGGAAALRLGRGEPAAGTGTQTGLEAALRLVASVRARGGRVVATGGCFDLLHAGHVSVLRASRSLGDCLVVCLNSDSGVRRLKGPGRPVVGEADRAAVLAALDCVDAVVTFDQETPVPLLERLRPDVFTKGGDYDAADLPERAALAAWGAEVVLLPYLEGRSTTRLVEVLRGVSA